MQKITLLALLVFILGCSQNKDILPEVKRKITWFYNSSEAKNYQPISYSKIDTTENIKDGDGKTVRMKGLITHKFKANSNFGELKEYTEVFEITAFKDSVFALPTSFK